MVDKVDKAGEDYCAGDISDQAALEVFADSTSGSDPNVSINKKGNDR